MVEISVPSPPPGASCQGLPLATPTDDLSEGWREEGEGEGWREERERILHGLDAVSEMAEARMFVQPVDLEEVGDYCLAVAFPSDLSTITERLKNGFYRYRVCARFVRVIGRGML